MHPNPQTKTSKHQCMKTRQEKPIPYIQSEISQLATARLLDIGRQLILPPQRRPFVDELALLVIPRARLTQLLAAGASWMSLVTLQQAWSTQGGPTSPRTANMAAGLHAYLDAAFPTSIAGPLGGGRQACCLLRHG